jgi:hypothetical protein
MGCLLPLMGLSLLLVLMVDVVLIGRVPRLRHIIG